MLARRFWSLLAICACAIAASSAHAATFVRKADLAVSLTPPAGPIYVGQQLTFSATLTNLGPSTVTASAIARIQGAKARIMAGMQPPFCCTLPGTLLATGQSESATWRDLYVTSTSPVIVTLKRGIIRPTSSDPNSANDFASFTLTPQIGRCTSPVPTSRLPDRVFGTVGGEVVNSGAGDDLIRTGDGDDCVNAGSGADIIAGGDGADLLRGGSGADTISGGPGKDKISGDSGNDTINAADGERDVVNCGPGKDKVKADRIDSLSHCERIRFAR